MMAGTLFDNLCATAAETVFTLLCNAHGAKRFLLNDDDRRLIEELADDVVTGVVTRGHTCLETCRELHLPKRADEFGAEVMLRETALGWIATALHRQMQPGGGRA